MLNYFKYIAVISFLLVILAAFFAGLYFRSFAAESVIRSPIAENNRVLVENFTKNILCKYVSTIKGIEDMSVADRNKDKSFGNFQKLSNTALSTNSAAKIILYDENGNPFLATNNMGVVFFGNEGEEFFEKAKASGKESQIIPSMGMYNENGDLIKGSYVRTIVATDTSFCPIRDNDKNDGKPLYIMVEIYNNVTKAWNELYFFQAAVTSGILVTFIMLYIALFFTSRKTEKLINKQHEEKLKLEKAKTAAEAQNQQKSMFLANVSHELRTPLNAIIGFSEIIKDEVMGPVGHPQYKEYVTDINSSGVHLLSLINDILDYSKAEARKLDVEAIDIDLTKIAHSCLRLVETRANEAKVKLIEELPEKHVVLSADPKRMKQVILNLLSNAVKFTQEGGSVTLTVKEDFLNGYIKLIVVDTGIGIAPKDISKAMAPFGQIDSSISRRYEGTGLGLPLTKKLTELMGGIFEIKSEVGLGTTIDLTFPVVREDVAGAKAEF